MNQSEIWMKWITALKSGEFKQNKGKLKPATTGQFCYLGVLCNITRMECQEAELPTPELNQHTETVIQFKSPDNDTDYGWYELRIPKKIGLKLGLNTTNAIAVPGRSYGIHIDLPFPGTTYWSLSDLNDIAFWNFRQIADLLYNALVMDQLFNI